MKISFLVNYDAPALLALNYLVPALGNLVPALGDLVPALGESSSHELSVFYTDKNAKQINSTEPKTALAKLALFDRQLVETAETPIRFDNSPFRQANKINTDDYAALASSKPDLIISIRHMTILRDAVIDLPKHGVINLHSGLLPTYQGVMASFRAMENNEDYLGSCLHFIEDAQIDTGSIIAQSQTRADYTRSYLWNVLNIYQTGCLNIVNAVESLKLHGTLESRPQTGTSNYFSYPDESAIAGAKIKLFDCRDTLQTFLKPK